MMSKPEPTEHRIERGFLLVFALLAAGILATGYSYCRNNEREFRAQMERELFAVADLKVDELVQWRQERMGEAAIFFKNPSLTALVRRYIEQPADAAAHRQLQDWLGKYSKLNDYNQIRLMDAQGVTLLSVPAELKPASANLAQAASEALRSGQMAFQDFYWHEQDQHIYLAVLVPILDEADGSQPLGVLALRIDPESYLYPFIKRWPTSSPSAETLLVRRDGNEILYLNDLRHQSNAALALRFSLAQIEVPAVRAALGQTGIMSGVDYRGLPVLATAQAVPDSPWFLVAKVDTAEGFVLMRERRWQVIGMIGTLLLGAGACGWALCRQQRGRFRRARAAAAASLENSFSLLHASFESSADALLIVNETGQVIKFNQKFAELWRIPAAIQTFADDVQTRAFVQEQLTDPGAFLANVRELYEHPAAVSFDVLEFKDGRTFERSSQPWKSGGKNVGRVWSFRDSTARKQAEAQLQFTRADLKRSSQELEQFAYVASHDLQEPLRMISSYTQLLAERYEGQLDDKAQKYIRYAVDGATRMQMLINDLLVYSRVGSRARPLELTDSRAIFGEAIQNLSVTITENRAVITSADLPMARADASQLVLVFQNLLANAIKFRGQDRPQVHVSTQDRGHEWVFAVKDNGIGIEPQHAERVFVIFQRLHTREAYPGTGIGLAVCQRIVARHGGKIWFESTPGNGTTFFFTVPK